MHSFCSKSVKRNEVVKDKSKIRPVSSFVHSVSNSQNITHKKSPDNVEKIQNTVAKRINARDCNIFHIDSVIKNLLISEIDNLEKFYTELDTAIKIYENGSCKDSIIAKKRMLFLRNKIKNIENTSELEYYIFRTSDIIESYRTLTMKSKSFVCINKNTLEKESRRKSELLSKFIAIAREYIDIEGYHQNSKKLICSSCGNSDMRRMSDEDTTFICSDCGTEIQILDDTASFKDTDRINMCNRYTYSRKGHFIDAIKKHQGKQNTDKNIIKNVVNVLKKEMKLHNLTKNNVSKQHLYMFLSEKELSSHYDDLNLIYHLISGERCPDISIYEQKLLEDFDIQEKALSKVYEMDVNNTRLNSLNVYYKLYKLLQRCGYHCRKDDFYILKTKAKEDEHDEKMENAWGILGWDWIDTF